MIWLTQKSASGSPAVSSIRSPSRPSGAWIPEIVAQSPSGKAPQELDRHVLVVRRRVDEDTGRIAANPENMIIPVDQEEFRLDGIHALHHHLQPSQKIKKASTRETRK